MVPRVFASLISLFGTFCSTVALPAFNWGRLSKEMDPTRAAGNFCILAKFVPLSLPSGAATVDVMVLGAGLLQVGPEVHAAITIFCSFQQRRRTRNRRPFFGRRLFCSSFETFLDTLSGYGSRIVLGRRSRVQRRFFSPTKWERRASILGTA